MYKYLNLYISQVTNLLQLEHYKFKFKFKSVQNEECNRRHVCFIYYTFTGVTLMISYITLYLREMEQNKIRLFRRLDVLQYPEEVCVCVCRRM